MENISQQSVKLTKDDKSDRKATDMLIKSLFCKTDMSPRKLKQLPIDKYCSPNKKETNVSKVANKAPKLKKQSKKKCVVSPKLTSLKWLNSNNQDSERNSDHTLDKSTELITISCMPKKDSSNELRKNLFPEVSPSYKKYGINLPTFEDILKEREQNENYKKCLECISNLDFSQVPEIGKLEDFETSISSLLDCTHLTLSKIEQAFYNNLDYISDIHKGVFTSELHKTIFNTNLKSILKGDLSYNVSMIVFTYKQKQILSSLLYENFGKSDNQNYFKALMPEMCLKIFMDEFDMTYEEAYDYLQTRPVDI